jgi:ABC transport system ATP-binding/permease protein
MGHALVNLESIVKGYGHRVLLDGVSAGVAAGEAIGLVGRNGAGKSTLLGLLAGTERPDAGRVTRAGGLRVGHLPQADHLTGTVAALVTGGRAEHEWAGDPRIRSVIGALLPGIDFNSAAERLSGGEARRVALASLLAGEHDLLLLDEPTNHLDVEAVDWLARFLRDQGTAMVVVTHDRWFLDAATGRTWELADARLHSYDGGYAAYVLARAERARIADAAQRRQRNLLRKELAWLRRGPPARTSKPRFRIEAANALIADEPVARDGVELLRLATARLGKTVIDAFDVSAGVGGRVLLEDVTWQLGPGDRVGVLGPNGSGKTTFLRLLAGGMVGVEGRPAAHLAADRAPRPGNPPTGPAPGPGAVAGEGAPGPEAPAGTEGAPGLGVPAGTEGAQGLGAAAGVEGGLAVSGRVVRGKTVRLGYLEQGSEGVDPGLSAREVVAAVRGNLDAWEGAGSVGTLLDSLGLRGDVQFTPARELSGGERRRVQLLGVLVAEPNVLLLDEPTNDLDVDTLTELEDLLDGWAGSLVVVSHDRYFLERVTDHVVALLGDGKLSFLGGGIEEYLERRRTRGAGENAGAVVAGLAPRGEPRSGGGADRERRLAKRELQRLERQIDRLGTREKELTEELAAQASDYAALIELGGQLREVQAEKARLEEEWLAVAEDAE